MGLSRAAAAMASSPEMVSASTYTSAAPTWVRWGARIAAATAPGVGAVIAVLGDSLHSAAEGGGDRDDLDLPGGQLALLRALVAAAPRAPLVVVLVNGRAAAVPRVAAILTPAPLVKVASCVGRGPDFTEILRWVLGEFLAFGAEGADEALGQEGPDNARK